MFARVIGLPHTPPLRNRNRPCSSTRVSINFNGQLLETRIEIPFDLESGLEACKTVG